MYIEKKRMMIPPFEGSDQTESWIHVNSCSRIYRGNFQDLLYSDLQYLNRYNIRIL